MSEYEAGFEDDWAGDGDLLEDFEVEDDAEERVAEVSAEIAAWERETGVTLSDEDFDRMGYQLDLYNISPDDSYGETGSGRFDADFEATVEAVEREQGRKLLDTEIDGMWDAASAASEDPSIPTDAEVFAKAREAVPDMLATSDGRSAYIGRRLSGDPEREEPSATVVDEDGDERPGFNHDRPGERTAAIDALMAGEDVTTYDNDDIEGDQ